MKPESSTLVSPMNLNYPQRRILPDNRDLSLSILPMEIRRMDSGLDGLASHSEPQNVSKQTTLSSLTLSTGSISLPSRQSLSISSFSLYRLMLIGLLPSTVTLRFFKYFSSSLYGCLAPVLLKSNVMNKTGPSISDSLGTGVGLSVAGPIAGAVFSLVKKCGKVASALDDLDASSFFEGSQTWGSKFRGANEDAVPVFLFSSECSIGSVVVTGPGADELPNPKLMTAC